MVVTAEETAEAAAGAADRRPALTRQIQICIERDILALIRLTAVDRSRKCIELIDRTDQVWVRFCTGTSGKNAGFRLFRLRDKRLAQRVVDRRLDTVAALGCTGNTVNLRTIGLYDLVKERGNVLRVPVRLLVLADKLYIGNLAVRNRYLDFDLAVPIALSGPLIDTVFVGRAPKCVLCGQVAVCAGVHGIGRERAADEHDHQQHQGQEPFGECLVHVLVITS